MIAFVVFNLLYKCSCFVTYNSLNTALALGDPSVKIDDVTPKIFPSGPLFPTEVST